MQFNYAAFVVINNKLITLFRTFVIYLIHKL